MAIANYAKTCTTNIPGNQNLFFLEVASVATVTVTALEVAAITFVAEATTFHEFDADIDSIKLTMEGAGGSSFFQNNKIESKFSKMTKTLVTAKQSLVNAATCGAVAIVLDGNSQAWLVGWNGTELGKRPLNKITTNFDSGVKPSDEDTSAYTITLEGETGYDPVPFNTTTNAAIVAGTSALITWNS